jgi:hypothetical protein
MMSFLKYDYELVSYFLSMEFQRRQGRQAQPAAEDAGFLKTPVIALYYSMIDTAMTM